MNVSIELTKLAPAANRGKTMMLRDVDVDTALAISASLRALLNVEVEATIVVESLVIPKHATSLFPKSLNAFRFH